MIASLRRSFGLDWRIWLLVAVVLAGAAYLGPRASAMWLVLLAAAIAAPVILRRPALALPVLVVAALASPVKFETGTDVSLNLATFLIPALAAIWLLDMMRRRHISLAPSRANAPWFFFLAANLVSLLVGRATWDPAVPMGDNFLLVQLAQWAIFAFSALAFWLGGNLITEEIWLRRLTVTFLVVGGGLSILKVIPGVNQLIAPVTTIAFQRAPFWTLLAALAAGQLLFNRGISGPWRVFLVLTLGASLVYSFVDQQEAASNWIGLAVALGMLVWLRFPRLRWPAAILLVVLVAVGLLFPLLYEFAGGDKEWSGSGASRLLLIERVLEVSMRNPVTGLGPAAYRAYAGMRPLAYQRAYWLAPQINSHNNYVDIFAQSGVIGLAIFVWLAVAVARAGLRLRGRFTKGFAGGYVNAMLAAGAASLVIMLLADWILPFVYNVGFRGFQASVLVWLFLGGLVALANMKDQDLEGGGRV